MRYLKTYIFITTTVTVQTKLLLKTETIETLLCYWMRDYITQSHGGQPATLTARVASARWSEIIGNLLLFRDDFGQESGSR